MSLSLSFVHLHDLNLHEICISMLNAESKFQFKYSSKILFTGELNIYMYFYVCRIHRVSLINFLLRANSEYNKVNLCVRSLKHKTIIFYGSY